MRKQEFLCTAELSWLQKIAGLQNIRNDDIRDDKTSIRYPNDLARQSHSTDALDM